MDLGVTTQAHDVAQTGPDTEPAQQFIAREGTICRIVIAPNPARSWSAFSSRAIETDALTLAPEAQGLPEQLDGPGMGHPADAVLKHGDIQGQMKGVAWF